MTERRYESLSGYRHDRLARRSHPSFGLYLTRCQPKRDRPKLPGADDPLSRAELALWSWCALAAGVAAATVAVVLS